MILFSPALSQIITSPSDPTEGVAAPRVSSAFWASSFLEGFGGSGGTGAVAANTVLAGTASFFGTLLVAFFALANRSLFSGQIHGFVFLD